MPYKDPEKQKAARKRYEEKHKEQRNQRRDFWLFVFYPDSAPENWRDVISSWQCECLVSPLHDKDVNADGTPKKPHWHGILFFESKKTQEQAEELTASLNGPKPIRPSGSKRTACRYLIHADNPEKAQYGAADVLEFGGASLSMYSIREAENETLVQEMVEWCEKYECFSYRLLLQYSMRNKPEWFRALCRSCTYVMKEYLKSAYRESIGEGYSGMTLEEIEMQEDGD